MRALPASALSSIVAGAALAGCLLTAPPRSQFESGGTAGSAATGGGGAAGAPSTGGNQNDGGAPHNATFGRFWQGRSNTGFDLSPPPKPGELLVLAVLIDTDLNACTPNPEGFPPGQERPENDMMTEMDLDLWMSSRLAGEDMTALDIGCATSKWVAVLVSVNAGKAPSTFAMKGGDDSKARVEFPHAVPGWLPLFFIGSNGTTPVTCSGWVSKVAPTVGGAHAIELTFFVPEDAAKAIAPSCDAGTGWVAGLAPVGPR